MSWWPASWTTVFIPHGPILELVVRGTAVYLALYAVLRLVGRRVVAQFSMSDVLVVFLIAVAAGDGMTGPYSGVGDAVISGSVIIGWDLVVDWVGFRFESLRGILRPPPRKIIADGRLLVDNARASLLTRSEIMEKLRWHGVGSYEEVEEAYLEPDGSFTVVRRDRGGAR